MIELLIQPGKDRQTLADLSAEENAIRGRQLIRGKMREAWRKENRSITASESYKLMTLDGKREWEDLNRVERIHEEMEKIIKKHVH